jgi:hypothetical protein
MSNTPSFPATTITFEAIPLKVGTDWQIVATYPTGQKEQIVEFKNQDEAVAWIGSPRCLEWIKLRGYE